MTEVPRPPVRLDKIRRRNLIFQERVAVAEAGLVKPQPSYHPNLTKNQEKILFRQLKIDPNDVVALRENEEFMAEIKPEDRLKWSYQFAMQDNIQGVILACNYKLIVSIILRYANFLPFLEAVAAGQQGFLKQLDRFDPDRDLKVSSYFYTHILRSIQYADAKKQEISMLTYDAIREAHTWKHAFIGSEQREPTQDELRQVLMANTPMPKIRIDEILSDPRFISFNGQLASAKKPDQEKIPDVSADTEQQALSNFGSSFQQAVYRQMQRLTLDEQFVLQGVLFEQIPFATIASKLHKSEQEIKALFEAARTKMAESAELVQYKPESVTAEVSTEIDDDPDIVEVATTPVTLFEQQKSPHEIDEQLAQVKTRIEKIRILKLAGWTTDQMAEKLNIKKRTIISTVWYLRNRNELPPHDPSAVSPKTIRLRESVLTLRNQGKKRREIAEILEINEYAVVYHIAQLLKAGKIAPLPSTTRQEREAEVSEVTERVKKYLEDHPVGIKKRFKPKSSSKEPDA